MTLGEAWELNAIRERYIYAERAKLTQLAQFDPSGCVRRG